MKVGPDDFGWGFEHVYIVAIALRSNINELCQVHFEKMRLITIIALKAIDAIALSTKITPSWVYPPTTSLGVLNGRTKPASRQIDINIQTHQAINQARDNLYTIVI